MSARHTQIVPVLEIHNLPDDYMAIVMEYIAGGDLLTYVQTKRYGGGGGRGKTGLFWVLSNCRRELFEEIHGQRICGNCSGRDECGRWR